MKRILLLPALLAVFAISSCGGGEDEAEAKLSKKGKMLIAHTWKYDTNASISGETEELKDSTGVTADVVLKDDVKAIADFFTGTLRFGVDKKDPSKLSYERKYGKGLLSTSVLGYWNFNEDESKLIMREWDSEAGKEKAPVTYEIVELSDDKLVIKEEGKGANVYIPSK